MDPKKALLRAADETLAGRIDSGWVLENLPIGLFLLEVREEGHRILLTNPSFRSIFGLEEEAADGITITREDKYSAFESIIDHCLAVRRTCKPAYFEWHTRSEPSDQFFACHLMPRLGGNGEVYQILGSIIDRSAEKRAERILLHNALHDALTNLPNRVLFMEKIEEALERQRDGEAQHCAVLVINLDRFQLINETLGHLGGDEFLVTMATNLLKILRPEDTMARLSGDEFAILVSEISRIEDANAVADRVHRTMRAPFPMGDSEFYASVCIGISSTISSAPYADDLVRDADLALHRAKAAGRGETEVFHRDKHRHVRSQLQMEVALRKAVQNQEMELHYQAIVDLFTGRLVGFEALARWNHPTLGVVSPVDFIPIAEETGVIVELGRWALHTACEQLVKWRQEEPAAKSLTVAVNVSGVQFSRSDVAAEAEMILSLTGLSGDSLRLEITETTIMKNPEHAAEVLHQLRDQKIRLALDDFGTGYSSLSYLQRFPIDIVKIDRSCITDIESNTGNHRIVEIITMLGKTLGLTVVAEGIEHQIQTEILRDLGCQMGQGYLFSRPVPAKEARRLIALGDNWLT